MRAIRILQANWLNEAVSGDRNTVKLVSDDMAREAVEVHKIAEYAPEYDQPATAFPPRTSTTQAAVTESVVVEYPGSADPVTQAGEDLAEVKPPDERDPELRQPWSTASKAEWITWAAHGEHGQDPVTEEEAAAMSKIQLMSRYGGRL